MREKKKNNHVRLQEVFKVHLFHVAKGFLFFSVGRGICKKMVLCSCPRLSPPLSPHSIHTRTHTLPYPKQIFFCEWTDWLCHGTAPSAVVFSALQPAYIPRTSWEKKEKKLRNEMCPLRRLPLTLLLLMSLVWIGPSWQGEIWGS